MRVLWTLAAEQDRADIVDYIAQDNPRAAILMDELFGAAVGRKRPTPSPLKPLAQARNR